MQKIVAIAPIATGILALLYGGFSYTSATLETKFGPVAFSVNEKERVNVPVWDGSAAIIAGGAILLLAGKRS